MENVDRINAQLSDLFSTDIITGQAIWRVVWSDDQIEKRKMDVSPKGVPLLFPEVFEVKKYPYVDAKFILERLVLVPEVNQEELGGIKISYEPMWVFDEAPPTILVCKFIIDTVYAAIGKSSLAKYKEDTTSETKEERLEQLQQELFGNETNTGDALAYRQGIAVPRNYGENK